MCNTTSSNSLHLPTERLNGGSGSRSGSLLHSQFHRHEEGVYDSSSSGGGGGGGGGEGGEGDDDYDEDDAGHDSSAV